MKKITIIIIILLLISNNTLYAYAESAPGTISVSGGSIGSGGVEGNSNILKGTALTVIMATLASAGITVKLAAEDYAKGNTAVNYLENKFEEWDSKTNDAWDNYEKYRALNDTKVGEDGSLYIPEKASAIMQKFVNWLFANDDVNEIPQASGTTTINGCLYASTFTYHVSDGYSVQIYNYTSGSSPSNYALKDVAMLQCHYGNAYMVYAYSKSAFFSKGWKVGTDYSWTTSTATEYAGFYYTVASPHATRNPFGGLSIYEGNITTYLAHLNGQWEEENNAPVIDTTGLYGETLDIPQLVDESGNGKILIIQPGLIGSVQDSYTGSNNATIGIQDYLDALKDVYGQQAIPQEITDLPDITIPGEDAITGTKEEVAVIDRDIVLAPDITVPADPGAITWPEVPEIAVPVADPSIPADSEISIPAMSVDLTKIFPFCIPWDLYNLLSKFNADPVTPSVTINWGNILGSIGVNFTTTLDLHDYDDVAAILRNMETVAFVIGLAVATRQIFTQS